MTESVKLANGSHKILFFNPRSAVSNHRLPNSILQVAASVSGKFDYAIVDGNLENDPWTRIKDYLDKGIYRYFACTVMPGPQLKQAIPFTRKIKQQFPDVITIWGGYFPSIHSWSAIRSGYIDFLVRGCGDNAFPALLAVLENGKENGIDRIGNLVFMDKQGNIFQNSPDRIPVPENLQPLPYQRLQEFYPMKRYLPKTWLGNKTFSYHSSFGCPYHCAFCGVSRVYRGEWEGYPAKKIYDDLVHAINFYGIDSVEFLDSNFFASHTRIMELCGMMNGLKLKWWAEGRVDSLNNYSDNDLITLKNSGCQLVFMGAETSDGASLMKFGKGGRITPQETEKLVERFSRAGIIPELSFVLGFPASFTSEVWLMIKKDISFVRKLKKINPLTQFVLYVYSPVPALGTFLDDMTKEAGFTYPETLDDWLRPEYEQTDLRKNPGTPWLRPYMIRYIRDFETVLNAAYPGVSNIRVKGVGRFLLMTIGRIRYRLRWYRYPILLKVLLRIMNYHLPEKEGFYTE